MWQQLEVPPFEGGSFAWPAEFLDDFMLCHFIYTANQPADGAPSDRDLKRLARR